MVSDDAQEVDERGTKPVRNRTELSIANSMLPVLWLLGGFDLRWLIVKTVFNCRLFGVETVDL